MLNENTAPQPLGSSDFGQRVIRVRDQFGIGNRFHCRVRDQEFHHLARIGDMLFHAQRQRFHSLQDGERVVRTHCRAEVAQAFAPGAQRERRDARFFREHHAVEAVVRLA